MSLAIEPRSFDDPVTRSLMAALEAELDVRYAEDDVTYAHLDPDHAMLAMDPEDLAAPRGAVLVASLDDEPVGCVALRPAPTEEAATAELKRMYVAPEARGRGISRALLEALEDSARRLGYRRIILETGIRQPEAMALYASAGYGPVPSYGGYRAFPMSRCYAKDL